MNCSCSTYSHSSCLWSFYCTDFGEGYEISSILFTLKACFVLLSITILYINFLSMLFYFPFVFILIFYFFNIIVLGITAHARKLEWKLCFALFISLFILRGREEINLHIELNSIIFFRVIVNFYFSNINRYLRFKSCSVIDRNWRKKRLATCWSFDLYVLHPPPAMI